LYTEAGFFGFVALVKLIGVMAMMLLLFKERYSENTPHMNCPIHPEFQLSATKL
jgi:hypothetical protein